MFEYENEYKKLGYVAGIDEAGRGPLAGPVCCACVVMPLEENLLIDGVDDSKKLSAKKREELFGKIMERAISYCIVQIDEKTIDEINILNATKLGMKRALDGLSVIPKTVLIDAVKIDTQLSQKNIIHGDALSYNIACASILAKVFRDKFMTEMAKKYPEYRFEKHKGYGTKEHIDLLKLHGKCDIHRNSFIKHFVS